MQTNKKLYKEIQYIEKKPTEPWVYFWNFVTCFPFYFECTTTTPLPKYRTDKKCAQNIFYCACIMFCLFVQIFLKKQNFSCILTSFMVTYNRLRDCKILFCKINYACLELLFRLLLLVQNHLFCVNTLLV